MKHEIRYPKLWGKINFIIGQILMNSKEVAKKRGIDLLERIENHKLLKFIRWQQLRPQTCFQPWDLTHTSISWWLNWVSLSLGINVWHEKKCDSNWKKLWLYSS